jgi:hypothetical protein
MAVAMKLLGLAGAMATPHDEQYVQEYDPSGGSAPDECVLVTTPDITRAKHYPSIVEGWEDWKRVDTRAPVRADGKPNRPLTAFSVTFDPVPNA